MNQNPQTGTITAAQFSEEQRVKRKKKEVADIIKSITRLLENEQDERNALADALARNQKLATSEERCADGFSILYSDLNHSEYRVGKFREAVAALRTI